MDDKRLLLSISLHELHAKHGIKLDLSPKRYRFEEVFDAILRQLPRRRADVVPDEKGKDTGKSNHKRPDTRRSNSQKYLTGTKAIQKKYKCSFEEAEKILIEQRLNEELINDSQSTDD
ncbi:MAG: hypothetical protein WAV32_02950 [Halobacteriota archaeon]